MATFKLSDFFHLGIDEQVTKCEWILALDEGLTEVIDHLFTTPQTRDGPKTLHHNMRIKNITINGVDYDFTNYKPTGLYWNGHTPLYVALKVYLGNTVIDKWFIKKWTYDLKLPDGTPLELTNPFNVENIEQYVSKT